MKIHTISVSTCFCDSVLNKLNQQIEKVEIETKDKGYELDDLIIFMPVEYKNGFDVPFHPIRQYAFKINYLFRYEQKGNKKIILGIFKN